MKMPTLLEPREVSAHIPTGDRNIRWIERMCRIPEGKREGEPLILDDFQRTIIKGIYDTPTRLAIISMAEKNAKTALAAVFMLLHLVGPESRPNSRLYSTAQSRDQAALLWSLASRIRGKSPELTQYVTELGAQKMFRCDGRGTIYQALSADTKTKHGLSPVFVVHDELGQVKGPRDEMYEVIEGKMKAHAAPLSIVISTQAATDQDLLSALIDDAKASHDPTTKLFLWEAPIDCDIMDEDAWRLANPGYDNILNQAELRRQAETALRMPALEAGFRNRALNQRVAPADLFVSLELWQKLANAESEAEYWKNPTGPVYGGLDLSKRTDLTALVWVSKDSEGIWHILPELFTPSKNILERSREDRVPYDVWVKEGHLIATPGGTVDYAWVAERLVKRCAEWDVGAVAYDRWRMDILKKEIERIEDAPDIELEPFGQGFKTMGPALDAFEAELVNERIQHDGNPAMTFCAANAVSVKDPTEGRKLDKLKSRGRIDGMVALTMALGLAAMRDDPDNLDSWLKDVVRG